MDDLELFDVRVIPRNVQKQKVTGKDVQKYIDQLPDREDNSEEIEYDEELLTGTREGRGTIRGFQKQDEIVD